MDKETLSVYCHVVEAMTIHLYTKAASWDNSDCRRRYYPDFDKDVLISSNEYLSAFENVTYDLFEFGILKPIDRMCAYFLCGPEEFHSRVEQNWEKGSSYDEQLKYFVGLFGEFGTESWGLDFTPGKSFVPVDELLRAFDSLSGAGYVQSLNGSYTWTEKMRPYMFWHGHWPESAETDYEQWVLAVEAERLKSPF